MSIATGSEPVRQDQPERSTPRAAPGPVLRALRPLRSLWQMWFFAAVCVVWWFVSADSTSPYFPPLHDIMVQLWDLWVVGDAITNLESSLEHFAIGYALAGVLGIVIGVALWRLPRTHTAFSPLLYFIYVLPAVAILPAVSAVLGYGTSMKVTIIVLATIWPTLLNTIDGLRNVDTVKQDVAKVLRMSALRTVRSVVLPNAMPQIMAGLRNSLQIAIIMMVVSELVASTSGIGFFILNAQQNFQFTEMWTGVIVLGLMGSALTAIFVGVERMVLRWYLAARAAERRS